MTRIAIIAAACFVVGSARAQTVGGPEPSWAPMKCLWTVLHDDTGDIAVQGTDGRWQIDDWSAIERATKTEPSPRMNSFICIATHLLASRQSLATTSTAWDYCYDGSWKAYEQMRQSDPVIGPCASLLP